MTQPTQADTAAAAVASYQAASAATRQRITDFIRNLWASLPAYRNNNIAEFTDQAVPMVEAAMAHMGSLTSGFFANTASAAGGSAKPVIVKPLTVSDVRNGADPNEVYGRPFHLVWRQLASLPRQPGSIDQAIASGADRAVQLAVTDLQLAKTNTAQQLTKTNPKIVGYRRQLEGAYSCALCIVASTRRYHKATLLPIHPGCDCSIVPTYDGQNVDVNLDPALLQAAHATVAQQFGADSTAARRIRGAFKANGQSVLYRDVLITHDHGELGPILGVRGQDYTGPKDLRQPDWHPSSSGGDRIGPPGPPKPPVSSGGQSEDDELRRRQEALGIETHGETLTPAEVDFVERFQKLGNRLEWIPKSPVRKPTNDFIWLNNGGWFCELKSTKASYSTIHGRIVDAASRAAKQGVVKDNFVVDLAEQPLTPALADQLAGYNVGRRKYRLGQLWVLSAGVLTQIHLR